MDISAGGDHTCAVLDDGSVSCWGANTYGQLGDGTTTSRTSPTQTLTLPRPAIAVEAGMHFTCALLDDGSIACWGRNHYGQLGRGYTNTSGEAQPTPTLTASLPSGRHALVMDISHYHACAVLDDGSIACWGPGNNRRLGTGTTANQNTPTVIGFFGASNPATEVGLGRYSGCAVLENGSITCWGKGYLGTGGQNEAQSLPGVVWPNIGTGRQALTVELGRYHNCALLLDGNISCWGQDSYGQMGNGAGQQNSVTPWLVTLPTGIIVRDLATGHWHSCIAGQTNAMYCWGMAHPASSAMVPQA